MRATLTFRIFLPFSLGYLFASVFRSITAVIAPNIVQDIGVDATKLGLLSSGFFLGAIVSQLPLGIVLDRYGPRRLMLVGLTLVGIGFLAFSGITSLWMLYVVFFGMALGTSLGSFAPITVTVSNWFVRKRARALG